MNQQSENAQTKGHDQPEEAGKKFYIDIEDKEYAWEKDTITVPEIRRLGDIPADQSIIVEDPEGGERTLTETEIVHLKPGHRYGRAPKYRRG